MTSVMGDYIPTWQDHLDYIRVWQGVHKKTKFDNLVVSVMNNNSRRIKL